MFYEELLKEEGMTVKDLPQSITMKINFLNGDLKKLAESPTPELKEKIRRNDVDISDKIQTWIEKDLPVDAPVVAVADVPKVNSVVELQNSIVTVMNTRDSRYILETELAKLIGKKPNDNEKVGFLNLCQVYLSYPVYYKHYK